jgi:hypothetical protein
MTGVIPDNKSAEPSITNENIRAESEDEIAYGVFTGCENRSRKIFGGDRRVKQIGWTADTERGVWSYGLVTSEL